MFQEEIADLTSTHLRTHIEAYLSAVQALHADTIKLQMPKTIETANLVGGVYNTSNDKMPAYAVDVLNKTFAATTPENLWLYDYEGHIAGIISGLDEVSVNKLIKRHEEAVEKFVKDHLSFHNLSSTLGSDFTVVGFDFVDAAFSGAEELETVEDRTVWIAGFRIDLTWTVSEAGPGDHGT